MGPIPSLLLGIQLISRLALVQHTQGVTHVGSASRVRSRLYSRGHCIPREVTPLLQPEFSTGVLAACCAVHGVFQSPDTQVLHYYYLVVIKLT